MIPTPCLRATLVACALLAAFNVDAIGDPGPVTAATSQACGRMLFMRHCASCHGDMGLGDGPGADVLDPRPRDFSQGRFRLVSTENGIPTQQDVFDVITRGILGSAMPPHDQLSTQDRSSLAAFVLDLARVRYAETLQGVAEEDGETLSWEDALARAAFDPGPSIQLPPLVAPSPELLDEGRRSYTQNCAPCHDDDGRGRKRTDLLDEQGQPIHARDFTAGILKGGSGQIDIHRRIRCGMPGSPMPSLELPEREHWALLHHIDSLIPAGAQERLSQVHTVFHPTQVNGQLDADPAAEVWKQVRRQWIAMAPLQWHDERVSGFTLQVARDEHTLGLRLVWKDLSSQASGENITPDTATVRFSHVEDPQFFCPGREGESAEIWQWGVDSGDFSFEPLGMEIRSRRESGQYELVFLRALEKSPEDVGMSAVGASIAFELRNGAAGDADQSQNLTVWHRLKP